jgi:hypothetical protein
VSGSWSLQIEMPGIAEFHLVESASSNSPRELCRLQRAVINQRGERGLFKLGIIPRGGGEHKEISDEAYGVG